MAENESKSAAGAEALGLSERTSFDVKKPIRGESNEESQRPASNPESISTDRGKFTIK